MQIFVEKNFHGDKVIHEKSKLFTVSNVRYITRPNKVINKFLVVLPGQFFAKWKDTDRQTDNHKETLGQEIYTHTNSNAINYV